MIEIIKKTPDGKLEYDFEKYFNLNEALLAEWRVNSPDMSIDVLSQLMERIWDKKQFCTDGRGRFKPQRWEQYIREMEEILICTEAPCHCERLMKQIRENNCGEVRISGNDNGPAISMIAQIDNWTNKRIYFTLSACEEGENFSDDIKYCPFCGRKLSNLTIDDFKKEDNGEKES